MTNQSRDTTDMNNLWRSFDKEESEIVLYLIYTSPPVSIDSLCSLTGSSAIKVLNVMEALLRQDIVYEKKGFQKGIYFFDGVQVAEFVRTHIPENDQNTKAIIKRIIDFYEHSLDDDHEKILILADLFQKMGTNEKGLQIIRRAAEISYQSGDLDKALLCYDYVINFFTDRSITKETAGDYLECVLSKYAMMSHNMSSQEQISLLNSAQEIAQKFKQPKQLADIKLALAGLYQLADHKKSYPFIRDYQSLAEKIGDPKMKKRAALLTVEYLHWQGTASISDIIQKYENVIEDLEEFDTDESTLKATARVGACYVLRGRVARGLGMIDAVRNKAAELNLQRVSIFGDLMKALALLEFRKFDEAKPYIKQVSSFPDEILGHYILRPLHSAKAYLLCMEGNYKASFDHVRKVVEYSKKTGWLYHKGPWTFEYLDILEKNGYYHEDMNYDGEAERCINGSDMYMKGIAYRYRALKSLQQNKSIPLILRDLKNSEKFLIQSGGEIELARTRVVLGEQYLIKGEQRIGQTSLRNAWSVLSKIDRGLFPKEMLPLMPPEYRIEAMVDNIIDINELLSTAHDMSSFLEMAINVAMDFTMATRGAYITTDQAEPKIIASRNLDPIMFKSNQLKIIKKIVSATAESNVEIVSPGEDEPVKITKFHVKKAGISNLICLPVKLTTKVHGFLYLDNRLTSKPFPKDTLPFLRLLCNQIAIGISKIHMFDEVIRLKEHFEEEAIFYKREMGVTGPTDTIIGHSEGISRVIDRVHQVASSNSAVLILGETGVGKELVAKAIHNLSERKDAPFIPVNLAALPEELVASELFGHEQGAFTGANNLHKGRFELSNNGTIFLDEIGDLPLGIQVKLLRVIQEGSFERLGGTKQLHSNFRVIAATNKDLRQEVAKGNFRQDLYYRINVFPITVPPLRERKEDIPLLAHHFLEKYGKKSAMTEFKIPANELKKLKKYPWPGNVRELEHLIERTIILCAGKKICFSGLDELREPSLTDKVVILTFEQMQRTHIEKALLKTHGRVSGPKGAALLLDMKPTTLFYQMKKLGINKNHFAE